MTITKRNPNGTIAKGGKQLTSKQAADQGRKGNESRKGLSSKALLQQAGYDDPENAPEYLIILAEIGAGKSSGAVPAMNAFLRETSQFTEDTPGKVVVNPGDICPTCRQYVIAGCVLDDDQKGTIKEYIEETRQQMKRGKSKHRPTR